MYSLMWKLPTGASGSYLMEAAGKLDAPWQPADVADLTPGQYRVMRTTPKADVQDLPETSTPPSTRACLTTSKAQSRSKPDQTEKVEFAYLAVRSPRPIAAIAPQWCTFLKATVRRPWERRSRQLLCRALWQLDYF